MKFRVSTAPAAATGVILLSRFTPEVYALKPPYSEIYQTSTNALTSYSGDTTLRLYNFCDPEWSDGSDGYCYFLLPEDLTYSVSVDACSSMEAQPFMPTNGGENIKLLNRVPSNSNAWLGIISSVTDEGSDWSTYDGGTVSYYNWKDSIAIPAEVGKCLVAQSRSTIDTAYYWTSVDCSSLNRMVCRKYLTSLTVPDAEPPASVNGAGGGALAVPIDGEITLYEQFINPSTGDEQAYQYPTLAFVEADEDIQRVSLTSVQGSSLSSLFASTYSATSQGKVYYFTGEFSSWSAQQILTPPDAVDSPKNHFGSSLALNKKANMNGQSFADRGPSASLDLNLQSAPAPPRSRSAATMFVGCGNCSTVGKGKGAIYLYTQDAKTKTWSQSQQITVPRLYALGENQIVAYDDLLMADTSTAPVLFRKDPRGKYVAEQLVGLGSAVTMFDLYDETIVYSVSTARDKLISGAGAVYILAPSKPAPPSSDPKNKPEPRQWSLQQILSPPNPTTNAGFGSSLSLGQDRLAVLRNAAVGGDYFVYIFERGSATGMWSLQQQLEDSNGYSNSHVILSGSSLTVVHSDATVGYFNQFKTADCLVLSLEDQFGDGWDDARLEVTSPDGITDFYHSRCDLSNPHQLRYCPRNVEDDGLYRFRVVDIDKSNGPPKNVWELQWRVFNEDTATWVVGDWESKMDFEWDSENLKFITRKKEKTHTPNMTCTYCPPRPTDKPTPVLRSRHLKGGSGSDLKWSTSGPTSTPSPTLQVTNIGDWRAMVLSGNGWHRSDYLGASYYVSDSKSVRLVASGTLCPGEATGKECWVDLPNGDYNIRVGGALLADSSSVMWSYCRIKTPQVGQTQVSVRITDGSCSVISHHRVSSFCLKTDGTATVAIEFLVLGAVANQFEVEDSEALVAALSSALKVASGDVHIVSSAVSASGTHVTAEVDIHRFSSASSAFLSGSRSGSDILEVEGIDAVVSSLESYLHGEGPREIWVGLLSSPHRSIFSQSSSVEFLSVEVVGSKDLILEDSVSKMSSVNEVVSYADEPASNYNDPNSESASEVEAILNFVSLSGYAMAVGGLLVLVAGLAISARHTRSVSLPTSAADSAAKTETDDYSELEATEHSKTKPRERISLSSLYSSAPSVSALKKFVESEDQVLSMMLSQAPK